MDNISSSTVFDNLHTKTINSCSTVTPNQKCCKILERNWNWVTWKLQWGV